MSLPKLEHPTFQIKIPSTGKKFSFRPYTVKEQKILLMMKESSEPDEILDSLKELIQVCSTSKDFDFDKLTYFDIEYIFLQLRAKSVGETTELTYKCNNTTDKGTCGKIVKFNIKLDEIEVDLSTNKLSNIITINENTTINLRYPNLKSAKLIEQYNFDRNIENLLSAICIDVEYVEHDGVVYDSFSSEELKEFIKIFPLKTFEKILEFYVNIPRTKKELSFKCASCGYEDKITLTGITDFFE